MKNKLKYLPVVIIFIISLFVVFSCNKEDEKNDTDKITIIKAGESSDYVIIRGDSASEDEINAAVLLREKLLEITGVKLSIATDWVKKEEDILPDSAEIVVGNTNRLHDLPADNYYTIKMINKRIIINASPSVIGIAVQYFIDNFITSDGLTVPENLNIQNRAETTSDNSNEISESEYDEIKIPKDPGYSGMPAKSEIRAENGIPKLYINGEYTSPTIFFGNTDIGTNVTEQAILAANAGIHLHSVIYNLNFDDDYTDEESYALKNLRNCMDAIIKGDPYAKIILRVNTGAYYNPNTIDENDWRNVDRIEYTDGSYAALASTASDKWAEEASLRLEAIVEYMRSSELYADHLICIHLEKGEWFEQDFRERGSDISKTNDKKFRLWLIDKYKTDEELNKAWGATHGFSGACVPRDLPNNISSDHSYPNTLLLLPEETRFSDYIDYIGQLVSGRINQYAEVVKKASDNELLVIAFYGYLYELSDAQSGHYNMKMLLASDYIDGFAAPVSYDGRTGTDGAVGATSAYMTAVDSVSRHGKMWFQESDQRTFVNSSPSDPFLPALKSLNDIYMVHRREIGMGMVHINAMWAMDLGGTGWLLDPTIWTNLSDLSKKYDEYVNSLKSAPSFDAVFVVDEAAESVAGMPSYNVSRNLLGATRLEAYYAGVSAAFATMDDILNGKFSDASLYIFMNPYRISDSDAEKLSSIVCGDNKTSVYMYGFGETSENALSELTGMVFKKTKASQTIMRLTELGKNMNFIRSQITNSVNPRFSVIEGQSEVYAEWQGGNSGDSFVLHKGNGWNSIFFGGTFLDRDNIRAICNIANVNIISDANDVIIANDSLIVYCASSPGIKTINFGKSCNVEDFFDNKKYTAVTEITAEFEKGETRWFFITD